MKRMILRFVAVAVLVGCGAPQHGTVSGTVTLDGQPLTTGTVTFHPTGEGQPAYGTIDADGTYTLTQSSESVVAVGEYAVTAVSLEPSSEPSGHEMPTPGRSLIPSRYTNAKTSGLRFTIASGENQIDVSLDTSPRAQ